MSFKGGGNFYPPLNQKGPPLGWKIGKIVGMLILIAQKKGFDALNTTQKNPSSVQSTIFEKIKKNRLKMVKNG